MKYVSKRRRKRIERAKNFYQDSDLESDVPAVETASSTSDESLHEVEGACGQTAMPAQTATQIEKLEPKTKFALITNCAREVANAVSSKSLVQYAKPKCGSAQDMATRCAANRNYASTEGTRTEFQPNRGAPLTLGNFLDLNMLKSVAARKTLAADSLIITEIKDEPPAQQTAAKQTDDIVATVVVQMETEMEKAKTDAAPQQLGSKPVEKSTVVELAKKSEKLDLAPVAHNDDVLVKDAANAAAIVFVPQMKTVLDYCKYLAAEKQTQANIQQHNLDKNQNIIVDLAEAGPSSAGNICSTFHFSTYKDLAKIWTVPEPISEYEFRKFFSYLYPTSFDMRIHKIQTIGQLVQAAGVLTDTELESMVVQQFKEVAQMYQDMQEIEAVCQYYSSDSNFIPLCSAMVEEPKLKRELNDTTPAVDQQSRPNSNNDYTYKDEISYDSENNYYADKKWSSSDPFAGGEPLTNVATAIKQASVKFRQIDINRAEVEEELRLLRATSTDYNGPITSKCVRKNPVFDTVDASQQSVAVKDNISSKNNWQPQPPVQPRPAKSIWAHEIPNAEEKGSLFCGQSQERLKNDWANNNRTAEWLIHDSIYDDASYDELQYALQQQHQEQQRQLQQRLEEQRQIQQRLVEQRLEEQRLEEQRLEKQRQVQLRLKEQRLEQQRQEQQRLEEQRQEQQRLEEHRQEQQRLEEQRLEQQRQEQQRLEEQRLEEQRLEEQRQEQQRLEEQRQEQQRLEEQRLEQQRLEKQRQEQLQQYHQQLQQQQYREQLQQQQRLEQLQQQEYQMQQQPYREQQQYMEQQKYQQQPQHEEQLPYQQNQEQLQQKYQQQLKQQLYHEQLKQQQQYQQNLQQLLQNQVPLQQQQLYQQKQFEEQLLQQQYQQKQFELQQQYQQNMQQQWMQQAYQHQHPQHIHMQQPQPMPLPPQQHAYQQPSMQPMQQDFNKMLSHMVVPPPLQPSSAHGHVSPLYFGNGQAPAYNNNNTFVPPLYGMPTSSDLPSEKLVAALKAGNWMPTATEPRPNIIPLNNHYQNNYNNMERQMQPIPTSANVATAAAPAVANPGLAVNKANFPPLPTPNHKRAGHD